jgi:uncharacterized protein DUF6519/parallel beta helix pectate lyase-like protein
MSSDISRQRFNPANNFNSVLMQQGRVQLDADWNEWNEILDRRWRSETIDIIGRCVVPRKTPKTPDDGFAIAVSGGNLTIGRGRIYVDGLQAENHGTGDLEFDSILAESRGLDPVPYEKQPYLPNAPALPDADGPHLVYVDVWEREVTSVENPDLVENAVGVDTTSRLQTVWQVRVLPNVGTAARCATPDDQLPGWLDIIAPSAGRLTTAAVGVATPDDPCQIAPSGGYRGLENRTYRVEIHDAGAVGTATFKWSRDNASVATGISHIDADIILTVDRVAWDSERRFSGGDWVEITDDWREFSGQAGEIRRIKTVVDESRAITLDTALTSGLFGASDEELAARHTRIKRWDQTGIVKDSAGNTFVDLDAVGGPGVIDVPDAGTSLILEDGVEVTFTTDPDGGAFHSDDYWIFVARTADASVEKLDAAPPRGVHHHYCQLALVIFPDTMQEDCRIFWPPLFGGEVESCDCTICVTADQHNQGTRTIQAAVSEILKSGGPGGGGTICLGPGSFILREPVKLAGAFGVRIRGQGAATVVIQPPSDAAFIITGLQTESGIHASQWCTLDYLTIQTPATTEAPAIRLSNSIGTTIERVIVSSPTVIRPPGEEPPPTGALAGVLLEPGLLYVTKIRDNFLGGTQFGVLSRPVSEEHPLMLFGFYCEGNLMACSDTGIQLSFLSYYFDTLLARNLILETGVAGISADGDAISELEITGNTITPKEGDGIVVATGQARISDNRVVNFGKDTQNGIRLGGGQFVVRGNRLQGLRGNGLMIEHALTSAVVERNVFDAVEGNGLIMQPDTRADSMKVVGNELINIAVSDATNDGGAEIAGIYLSNVDEGAVSDNAISTLGTNSPLAAVIAGVRVDNSLDVLISNNTITNIAPAAAFVNPAAGILVNGPIVNIEIADNFIRRQIVPNDNDFSPWEAIRILGMGTTGFIKHFAAFNELSPLGKVNAINTFAAAAIPQILQAGITSNSMHGYGRGPLIEVLVPGSCRFSDNYGSGLDEKVDIAVALTAQSIVASANRVECARNTKALNLTTANEAAFTVLGNIVGGSIVVNDDALPAPWQPLNVFGA